LLITLNVSSQEIKTVFDVGLWTGIGVDYKLNKRYSLSFKQELRLYESFSEIEKVISDLGVDYKINKEFGLGANIRYYTEDKDDKPFANDFRYNLDFKFKKELNDFITFKYRLRYQDTYESFFDEIREEVVNTFRNKVSLDYALGKHTIYFKTELFRRRLVYKKPYFSKIRLGVGDEFETKLGEFDYSLAYEHELGSAYPLDFFFLRVYYTFKLKK
jgi:hypothetical protein